MADESTPVIVTMTWEQVDDALLAHLARYVVLSRDEPGCRNVDFCASLTATNRVVVIEKWAGAAEQRAHFDGAAMVALAQAARASGSGRPSVDLLEGISMHDLI
jgi:quinol monooxygenase YgiN